MVNLMECQSQLHCWQLTNHLERSKTLATSRHIFFFSVQTRKIFWQLHKFCISHEEMWQNKWLTLQSNLQSTSERHTVVSFGTCRQPVFSAMAASVEYALRTANNILTICHMTSLGEEVPISKKVEIALKLQV